MPKKNLIKEFKKLLIERGQIPQVQREYAMVEEQAIMQMYPITKPSEEKRHSYLRTLESYIGEHAAKIIRGRN